MVVAVNELLVITMSKVTVPVFKEILVPAGIEKCPKGVDILIEPQQGLQLACIVNKTSKERLLVKVVNMTAGPVQIPRRQGLGFAKLLTTSSPFNTVGAGKHWEEAESQIVSPWVCGG